MQNKNQIPYAVLRQVEEKVGCDTKVSSRKVAGAPRFPLLVFRISRNQKIIKFQNCIYRRVFTANTVLTSSAQLERRKKISILEIVKMVDNIKCVVSKALSC